MNKILFLLCSLPLFNCTALYAGSVVGTLTGKKSSDAQPASHNADAGAAAAAQQNQQASSPVVIARIVITMMPITEVQTAVSDNEPISSETLYALTVATPRARGYRSLNHGDHKHFIPVDAVTHNASTN